MVDTLGHRRELCFWGWGYADAGLSAAEQSHVAQLAGQLGTGATPAPPPRLQEFDLQAPRLKAPDKLAAMLSATPYDRITHGYGKSFADLVRMQGRSMANPPDCVV